MEAGLLLEKALIAHARSQHADVLRLCDQILQSRASTPHQRASAHQLKCWTLTNGLHKPGPEAVRYGRLAIHHARRAGNPELLTSCLVVTAVSGLYSRALNTAEAAATEVIERAAPAQAQSYAHSVLGMIEYTRHNYGAAAGHYKRAVALDPSLPWPRIGLGGAELRMGRPWRALQLARQGLELSQPDDIVTRGHCLALMASARVEMADYQAATELLQQVHALAEQEDSGVIKAMYYFVVFRASIRGLAPQQARTAGHMALIESRRSGRMDLYELISQELERATDQEQWVAELEG